MISPVFASHTTPGFLLRLEDEPGTMIHVALLKVTDTTPSTIYPTVAAAEDELLGLAEMDVLIPDLLHETEHLYSVTINTMANRILLKTRRGSGNRILMNTETAKRILPFLTAEDRTLEVGSDLSTYLSTGDVVGRWTRLEGKLHNTYSLYVSSSYKPDILTVCYRGATNTADPNAASEIDAAGLLIPEDGGYRLVIDPSDGKREFLAEGADYARSVIV